MQKNQEVAIIQVPLKDQKDTYLVSINGDFWYKRILKKTDDKQTVDLVYDAEGFLKVAIHAHTRVDFYILKKEAYNFHEHHLNSKSQKYHQWEDFDFLDFDYVEHFKDLYSLVFKDTSVDWGLINAVNACMDLSFALTWGQIPEPYPNTDYYDCMDNSACACARCDHYTHYLDLLKETCPSGYAHMIWDTEKQQKKWCDGCVAPPYIYVACPKDILPDMQIAPTKKGGKKAGMYGDVREYENGKPRNHNGIDIVAPIGTPFVAIESGTVTFASYKIPPNQIPGKTCWIDLVDGLCKTAFGNFIQIKSSANMQIVSISYAHLSEIYVVKGQYVKQGEVIGLSGNSGNAVGKDVVPHVHITVYNNNGKPINPEPFLNTKFDTNGNQAPNTQKCRKIK